MKKAQGESGLQFDDHGIRITPAGDNVRSPDFGFHVVALSDKKSLYRKVEFGFQNARHADTLRPENLPCG